MALGCSLRDYEFFGKLSVAFALDEQTNDIQLPSSQLRRRRTKERCSTRSHDLGHSLFEGDLATSFESRIRHGRARYAFASMSR